MKKLTKEQKKIIYISIVVLMFMLSFSIFVYRPQARKLASITKQLNSAEAEISEINSLIADKDFIQAVKELNIRLNKIAAQLPSGDEDLVDALSQKARSLRIEVKNIIPSESRPLEKKIFGYDIEELSISMHLVCEYNVLGKYLIALRNDFPVLVRVNKLDIKGKGEGKPALDINLQITAYLSKGS